jgi:hypothetical protein
VKGRYVGPGATGRAEGFDTGKLVEQAFHTALEHETRRTVAEFARRGIPLTMLDAGRLVEQRIQTEGIQVLGENFVNIAARAERMHVESGGQPKVYGNSAMSGETEHVALAGAIGIREPGRD